MAHPSLLATPGSSWTTLLSNTFHLATTPLASSTTLWVWYAGMCAIAVLNLTLLVYAWHRIKPTDRYGATMKALAVPWVWECAYRSVFPSLYLQRYVFWDTSFNSIIVDRTFACVGELCWCTQFALALMHLDKDINQSPTSAIQISGVAAIIIYVLAECTSYYNVATTNELWCAVEVALDGISFLVMAPGALYLCFKCPGKLFTTRAKLFLLLMGVLCVVYPCFNFLDDVPMYLARYKTDQANHKQYLEFLPGLKDAATRRVVAHELSEWKADMLWMSLYFSIGSLSGILLMFAPRLTRNHTVDAQLSPRARNGAYASIPLAMDMDSSAQHEETAADQL